MFLCFVVNLFDLLYWILSQQKKNRHWRIRNGRENFWNQISIFRSGESSSKSTEQKYPLVCYKNLVQTHWTMHTIRDKIGDYELTPEERSRRQQKLVLLNICLIVISTVMVVIGAQVITSTIDLEKPWKARSSWKTMLEFLVFQNLLFCSNSSQSQVGPIDFPWSMLQLLK